MASRKNNARDVELLEELHHISKKSPKLIKPHEYSAPADSRIKICSWKMNEYKYYDIPSPFPTLARGLFTVERKHLENDDVADEVLPDGQPSRIVIRGYDKFFNIGEVPWCTWPALEDHTSAPYILSLKSNGCIIFIAALTPTKLLVTSKHSLGHIEGVQMSHAEKGEEWLRKYLDQKGKKEEDLAKVLWDNNWTAIAELCDDSFEEHVLPYPPELTGLHLHGLNVSMKDFATLDQPTVDAFATEWGFIRTRSVVLNSIDEVRSFAEKVGRTGMWDDEMVEGFVVRTHVSSPPTGSKRVDSTRSPYAYGSSFFFKIKFDEPYMMYRDWREVTKSLLAAANKDPLAKLSTAKLPKSKMQRPETKVYVKWVIEEIRRDIDQFKDFAKGKGIIATRQRFLDWLKEEEKEGRGLDEAVESEEELVTKGPFEKTIIVPVAIPGCGKTAVSVALSHLFGFGHTQSDDVQAKKPAAQFLKNVTSLLKDKDVVIADKNNHLRQHRQQLFDLAHNRKQRTRLLYLNWSTSISAQPPATVHRVCSDRILDRGGNHQSLTYDASEERKHEEVVWMFINQLEELSPEEGLSRDRKPAKSQPKKKKTRRERREESEEEEEVVSAAEEEEVAENEGWERVGEIVDMNLEESLEQAVRRAVDACVRVIGVERPSDEEIQEAVAVGQGYSPAIVKREDKNKAKAKVGTRYFGLLPEIELYGELKKALETAKAKTTVSDEELLDAGLAKLEALKVGKRITARPHVTIVHSNNVKEGTDTETAAAKQLWAACHNLRTLAQSPLFAVKLGNLVWNERVMALTVDDVGVAETEVIEDEHVQGLGKQFLEGVSEELKKVLHVTVGTAENGIAAYEAKGLVDRWRKGEDKDEIKAIPMEGLVVKGRVKGLS